ncbi:MAG: PD-(D/E)XK nuclease-like domain-containing protein [Cohaesibacter sp.]|nr:PD-(D/E)XK nuclease-like domain-containing protein [Cohaesibacter sp.]
MELINQADDLAEVEDAPAIEYPNGPAIIADMPNEVYHAGKGTSKSTLWSFGGSKSPAHFRHNRDNPKPKTAAQINQFAMGSAIHTVIMEPHLFEETVVRGPSDRRGKKWKDLQEAYPDANILLDKDYDGMDCLRDKIHCDDCLAPILNHSKTMIEHSAFWNDHEIGMLCKCRPDLVNPAHGLIVDIKTTGDATPWEFAKIAGDLGYHAQENWYTNGWMNAGGQSINGFVFLVVERDPPF